MLLSGSKIILFAEHLSTLGEALAQAFDSTPISTANALQLAVSQGDYFVSITDIPYTSLVDAAREVNKALYSRRFGE